MQNWNPAWNNYPLDTGGLEWFILALLAIFMFVFMYPIRIRRRFFLPVILCLFFIGGDVQPISATTTEVPKRTSNQTLFVLPMYASEWEVSLSGVAAPTGPTFLHSYAKSIGFGKYDEGKCIDLAIHNEDKVLAEIKSGDLVCVTAIVSNYPNSLAFIKKAKEQGATVAIGGPWASVRARQIHFKNPEIDYVVAGEGEAPLQEIMFGRAGKGILKVPPLPLIEVPSLDFSGWAREDLEIYYRNYIAMLESGKYGPVPDKVPVFVFYQSSRGCVQQPRCKFCGSRLGNKLVMKTATQFYKDVDKIVEQFAWLKQNIHIFDCSDSFASSLGRFEGEFYSFPGVALTVYARADEVTVANAEALRRLGVIKVSLGIETGSNEALTAMGKRTTTEQNLFALATLKQADISVYVNLMYGLPGETPQDLERTVDHFIELSKVGEIYRVAGRVMTPLPNARWFFDLLRERPELRTEDDWLDLPRLQSAWLESMTNLTLEDIQKAHTRLVNHAHEKGISVSSETVRGIV